MKSVTSYSVENLKAYFEERIRHCFDYALADYFERKTDEEYWKLVSEIETFLNEKKERFVSLNAKTVGLTGMPPFIDQFIKNLPKNDRTKTHRTNEGIDHRLCISILFAIDVFEQNRLKDLSWLKKLLIEIQSDLTKCPPSQFGFTREKMPFPTISNDSTEDGLKWKKELKYKLTRRLFSGNKKKKDLFYEKLKQSEEYDYLKYLPSKITHGDTEIDEYYFNHLMID